MNKTDYGKLAYNAYKEAVEGKNFLGESMPPFSELNDQQKNAWRYAIKVVFEQHEDSQDD